MSGWNRWLRPSRATCLSRWTAFAAWLAVALAAAVAVAQPPDTSPTDAAVAAPAETVTVEEIDRVLEALAADATLDEETRTQVEALAQQAKQDLSDNAAFQESTAEFQRQLGEIDSTAESLRQQLESIRSAEVESPPRTTIAILKAELADLERQLEQARSDFTNTDTANRARPLRRQELRDMLLTQPQKLARVQADLQSEPAADQPALLTQVRRQSLLVEQAELQAQPVAATAELAVYDAEDAVGIPRLRESVLQANVDRLSQKVKVWQEEISRLERIDVQSRIAEIEMTLQGSVPPSMRQLLQENLAIVEDEAEQRLARDAIQRELQQVSEARTALQARYDGLRERDTAGSQSTALGIRLREQRASLPETRILEQQINVAVRELEEAELARLDRDDELRELGDGSQAVDRLVANARRDPPMSQVERQELEQKLQEAINQRLEYLPQLIAAHAEYSRVLSDYIEQLQAHLNLVQEVAQFCDERILWIRSHRAVWTVDMMSDTESLTWIISTSTWRDLLAALKVDVWKEPVLYVAAIAIFVVLVSSTSWHRRQLRRLSKVASSRILGDIKPTLKACLHTFMLAIAWPSLGLLVGYRMAISTEGASVVRRMGHNFIQVSLVLLFLELLRHVVRPNGLAESHFRWSQGALSALRQQIKRWTLLGIPLLLLIAILNARVTDSTNDLLERLAFVMLMIIYSAGLNLILRSEQGGLNEWLAGSESAWLARLHGLWSLLAVGLPLVFAGLALAGYYYTAIHLLQKLALTLAVVLFVVLLRAVVFRWLMLRRRRLAIEQARERRAQTMAAVTGESSTKPIPPEAFEAPPLDLAAISDQSRRMIGTTLFVLTLVGCWWIWVDVLPALNYFERWGFDVYEQNVEEVLLEDGTIDYESKLVSRKISIVSMMRAILIVVLMVTAARNLPGMLEIILLEKLPVVQASRYAVTTIVRYGILLAGVIFASQAIGLSWSRVQWLAAALTFGLGFGLQEIFANFVSGLIILFEQPVRVGDVITIDGITGKVTRIRIRSTTLSDWDRKDYIVPNREFITGKLLNWTRSDTVNRLAITVGISYNSDADKAKQVILKLAEEHPLVMKDPKPVVFMEGFGDSALNMKLHVFLPDLESRLEVLHQLNVGIHRALAAHGIEIPFPQTDLHLRTWPDELTQALAVNHHNLVSHTVGKSESSN